MSDSLKIWMRLLVAAVGVVILVLISSLLDDDDSGDSKKSIAPTTVARCRPGVVMTGGVFPDWQEKSIDAGPVGIRKRPLRAMQRQPDGTLVTKMPVLIDGQDKVTIAAVAGMKDRVRFFYGAEARSFSEDEGFPRVRFRPCEDRQQTVWPGGIRVKGDGRVRVKITVADQKPFKIGLGFPADQSGLPRRSVRSSTLPGQSSPSAQVSLVPE